MLGNHLKPWDSGLMNARTNFQNKRLYAKIARKIFYYFAAMKLIKKLFGKKQSKKKESVLTSRIFEQQSWIDKKVQEAVWKKQFFLD